MAQAKMIVTCKGEAQACFGRGMTRNTQQIVNIMEFEKYEIPRPEHFNVMSLHFTHGKVTYDVIADARFFIEATDGSTFYLLFRGSDSYYFELNIFEQGKTSNLKVYQDEGDLGDDIYEFVEDFLINYIS